MNPMNIDMSEVLRLTRNGQLAEALSMIQTGRPPAGGASDAGARGRTDPPADRGVIDMVAPRHPGGSWTPASANEAASGVGIPNLVRDVLDRAGAATLDLKSLAGFEGLPGRGSRTPRIPLPDGARFEERSFTNEAGTRPYKLYIPSGREGRSLPLVVMLHGCTQSPDDFAAGTRMNELAEEQGFLVVYPGQPATAHPQRCWKWFSAGDQQRGRGEPSLIAGITRTVMAELTVDATRVYVAGLSAGGAAAAVMGQEYPDLFAAVGVHSGLACGSANDLPTALAAMRGGGVVRPRGGRAIMPTIVFHGDRDRTVHASNGEQVIAGQMGGDLRAVTTRGASPAGVAFTRTAYADPSGREWLVHVSVSGAGHAWAGGGPTGSFTDPRGPDASREMLRFFAEHANGDGSVD